MPTQPRTAAQITARNSITATSQAWSLLTDAQRGGWASLANQLPRKDSLGQTYFMTGFQTFVSSNARVLPLTGVIQKNAPMRSSAEAALSVDVNTTTMIGASVEVDGAVALFDLNLQSSPPVGVGVSFNGDFRTVVAATGYVPGTAIPVAAPLATKWGTLSAGQKFFLRAVASVNGLVIGKAETSFVVT